MRKVEWKHSAVKDLRRLAPDTVPLILDAVKRLVDDPRPPGCQKLQGSEHTYRIRVGDYRIVYSVEDRALLIWIIRVGHRKDVYR